MSKKRKKTQTSQRNAARRARRAAERRARRRAAPSRERAPLRSFTFTRDGLVTLTKVPGEDVDAHLAYLEAHRLLPPGYPTSEAHLRTEMAMALFTLDDPDASPDSVLRAIVILAHTPDERALAALVRYASSGRVHADLAKPAATECDMWLQTGGISPPRAPQPAATMN